MGNKGKTAGKTRKNITDNFLSTAEFRYKTIIENIPQKAAFKDKNSVYVFCNENYARDLKIKAEKIAGKTDYDFFPKELAEKYRSDDKRIMDTGKAEELEESYIQDGQEVIVNTFKSPVKDNKGNLKGVFISFWDITKYRTAEILAIKQNAVINAINKVFREALLAETEEDLARTCIMAAEDLTNSSFGFIGEVNPAGRLDTIALSDPGWDSCRIPETNATKIINDMELRGIWSKVIRDERSWIINDPESDPDYIGLPPGHPSLRSFLGVPLQHGGKTFGLIALANKENGYDLADQEALEALSVAIVEVLRSKRTENKLAQQAQEIMELSTPVVQVWEGVVVAPLIGMLDSRRTQGFMERFLKGIVEKNAPVALVDITGVPIIDTQTAQHIIEAISAARLLGTKVILTGVRPAIAQTLVHLGIDLSEFETRSSLSAGLHMALNMLDLEVVKKGRNFS